MNRDTQAHAQHQPSGHGQVPWTVRDSALGIALVAAGTAVIVAGLGWAYRGEVAAINRVLISAVIILPHVVMVLAVWLLCVRKYGAPWGALGFARPQHRLGMLLPWLALTGSIGFGAFYVIVVSALSIDFLLPPEVPSDLLGGGVHKLFNIAIIGLLGPLVEELFFRGFVLAALVKPLGPVRGAMAGSAIFAVAHVNVGVMVPLFASGMLLSWLYLKTRSIWPPLTAHAAQNLLALSLAA